MLNHTSRGLVLALFAVCLGVAAYAAVPTFWRLENQADFLPGTTDGVSISSDGTMSLAPATQVLAEVTDPQLWSLAVSDSGTIYAGSGNEGKVYVLDGSGGEARVLLDANELQVHALAADRGNVYVGTSPRGAVQRVASSGAQEIFFDPEDRYIWALAADGSGNLIVATGDDAQIYRVSASGESEVLFTSEESHIMSLAVGRSGEIYAGTAPTGLVLVHEGDSTRVLYDTPFEEVRALEIDGQGNVYALTVNGSGSRAAPSSASAPAPTPTPSSPVSTGGGESVTVTTSVTAVVSNVSSAPAASTSSSSAKGGLFRIRPDGAANQMWQSTQDIPLSLALARDDRLMVGTGNEGRVYLIDQNEEAALLLSLEADQVTAIAPGPGGETYLSTSNAAKVYRLNRGRRTEGTFRSVAKDTETVSSWGQLRWEARTPEGTSVAFQSRSGNSATPDNTWSEWSQPYTTPDGAQVQSPRGRFIQWRAILSSTGELSPELLNVTLVYLQQNLAPEVTDITLHPPGQTFQKPIVTTGQVEILGLDGTLSDPRPVNGSGAAGPQANPALNLTAISRPMYRKGIRTVTWNASDPNGDELVYDVHYRAEGETLWRALREGLTSPVIAWDTVAMPDGRYNLRVIASDSPKNPDDVAREGERTSRSFEVDNTPPRVSGLEATRAGDDHRVSFRAEDEISAIRLVEYSINSGEWRVVFPEDGIADSTSESYAFDLRGYGDGVFTLVVKVTDNLDNTGTARTELR